MTRLTLILTLLSGLFVRISAQLSGDYVIDGTNNLANRQFATLQDAFTALSNQGAQGTVDFFVVSGYNPAAEPSTIRLRGFSWTGQPGVVRVWVTIPVTIAKSPAVAARALLRIGGGTGNIEGFELHGLGNLTLREENSNSSTVVVGIIPAANQRIHNILIDSCNVDGVRRQNTYAGIYVGDSAIIGNSIPASANLIGLTISNCRIQGSVYGVYGRGGAGNFVRFSVTRCIIGLDSLVTPQSPDSSFGGALGAAGVAAMNINSVTIEQNIIRNALQTVSSPLSGIFIQGGNGHQLRRNYIYNIRYTGTSGFGGTGIRVLLGNTPMDISILNNFIARIGGDADSSTTNTHWSISGIALQASTALANAGVIIRHNTIHLFNDDTPGFGQHDTSQTTRYDNSFAVGILMSVNVQGGVTIEHNLIQNNHRRSLTGDATRPPRAYGIVAYFANFSGTINYNAYRIASGCAGGDFIGRIGNTNYATLADWQSAGYDANGISLPANAPFVSKYDLHLQPSEPNPLIAAGQPGTCGAAGPDFDGEARCLPNPPLPIFHDPGGRPDIGADELIGTPCKLYAPNIIATTLPNAGSGTYLFGTTIRLEVDASTPQPPALGNLRILYSFDGTTWIPGPSVPSLPFDFTLPEPPPLTPLPTSFYIALEAENPPFPLCGPLTPVRSAQPLVINVTDRPGNRRDNAIPVQLSFSGGVWQAVIQDSTDGPGVSNRYIDAMPLGANSRDLHFVFSLPVCMDSVVVNTCDAGSDYNTRIVLINTTNSDITADDDQGPSCTPRSDLAQVHVLGRLGSEPMPSMPEDPTVPTRDTMPLQAGHQLLLVVEGSNNLDQGNFVVQILAYPRDTVRIRTQSDNTIHPNGATHNISSNAGSVSETFEAVTNALGNSYTWTLYDNNNNVITTASTSNFTYDFTTTGIFKLKLSTTNPHGCDEEDSLFINVSVSTALGMGRGSFSVVPNPSQGTFTVYAPAAGTYDLSVIDLTGRIVYRTTMQGLSQELRTNLPVGTYQLLISGEGRKDYVRLLITE